MSYFDTTVFNRTAQQQKETKDLLRELIKTLQEQKSKCRYPTQNFEPPTQAPAQHTRPCVVCRSDEPFTGTCGSRDPRALCKQPTTTAQAADSVPAVEREQERIAFKDAHRHLELYEVPDAWGRPMFKHYPVEASWLGWIARASHGQSSPQADEYPALVCDYCGVLTPDPWHSSGMLHGKMSKHIHSCDACAARGQAPASVLHLVNSAFAEIAMAFPKAFALHKVGIADKAVLEALAAPATAQADSVQKDAACWHWLAEYLVGTRTDLDDEIVASETVNDLRKLVEAAIKQGANHDPR